MPRVRGTILGSDDPTEDKSLSELVIRLTETTDRMAYAGSCPGLGDHVEAARGDLDA